MLTLTTAPSDTFAHVTTMDHIGRLHPSEGFGGFDSPTFARVHGPVFGHPQGRRVAVVGVLTETRPHRLPMCRPVTRYFYAFAI